mgnify:CR=1 FL=1
MTDADLPPLDPTPPGLYRHYKGGWYEVLDTVRCSETLQGMTLYRALYGGWGQWVRPAAMFAEVAVFEGREQPRFVRYDPALVPLAEKVPSLAIHMDIEEPLTLEDPHRAHVLLRCTQEIITNTVRHAGARNLWLHCRRDGAAILIDARDDGAGSPHVVAGNGLTGMRERLAQYGGELRIETRPGQGFRLHIALPVSDAAPALAPLPVHPPEPTPELSSGGTL